LFLTLCRIGIFYARTTKKGMGVKKNSVAVILLLVIGAVFLIFALPHFLNLVEILGKRIPQKNIRLDYLTGVAWAVFLGGTIYCWPVPFAHKKALWVLWGIKCFVMLVLMLFYEHHYQVDSFGYFSSALHHMREWKRMEVLGPSSPVILFIQLHRSTFLNSFHAVKVSFGMVGFLATYIFYLTAAEFLRKDSLPLLYAFTLLPSILFWSSTIGKEPVILIAIAVYCYGVVQLIRTNRGGAALFIFLGMFVAVSIRLWLGIILGVPVLLMTMQKLIFKEKNASRAVYGFVLMGLIIIMLFSCQGVFKIFKLKSPKDLTLFANVRFTTFSIGESLKKAEDKLLLETKVDQNTGEVVKIKYKNFKDLAFFFPAGVFAVLFRPFPGEVHNIFGLLAGFEDVFLLIFFIIAVFKVRWRRLADPFLVWSISLIVIWASAYAFVSYNLGTVCRYRTQILPVFLGVMVYFVFGKAGAGKAEDKEQAGDSSKP
jgi:hypothetical protein